MYGVERMERNTIARDAVFIFVLFNLNTIRVVRTHFVQSQNVHYHQRQEYDWQGNNVQGKETVQGNAGNQVVTANPLNKIITNNRDSAEQGHNYLRTPVRHLPPR